MSGFEIAGIALGAFPLIISGLEHWREVARIGGFFWRIRKEHSKCLLDVNFHRSWYHQNLKELLLSIVDDADDVDRLISEPGGKDWSSKPLQSRLEGRLQESYGLYMEIVREMNETAEEMKKKLALDNTSIQSKLSPPKQESQSRSSSPNSLAQTAKLASLKSKYDYETFRIKFSLGGLVREDLLAQMKKCNKRLEKLLASSKVTALQNAVPVKPKNSALEALLKTAWEKSDLLFKALHNSWQCSCLEYHFANLRLEHRTFVDIYFEVILTSITPPSHENPGWTWRELRCVQTTDCPTAQEYVNIFVPAQSPRCQATSVTVKGLPPTSAVQEKELVTRSRVSLERKKLCQCLSDEEIAKCVKCVGIISHDNEAYHLHRLAKENFLYDGGILTLDRILTCDFEGKFTRRQRYSVALVIASSVAQLQFTSWLRTCLTKRDIFFFSCGDGSIQYHAPFIRQGFRLRHPASSGADPNDYNFYSLGILLLELCFARRLEDHPLRKELPEEPERAKQACDLMVALKWSKTVADEGGEDYASAVKWCFTEANFAHEVLAESNGQERYQAAGDVPGAL